MNNAWKQPDEIGLLLLPIQMPEELLVVVVGESSQSGDLVILPFAVSATLW